jgi:putative colanic acid biosynthesis acetyltransferase WcaF
MSKVDLSSYRKQPQGGWMFQVRAVLWFFLGLPLLRSTLNPLSSLKCALLRLFGAQIGMNVVIKPGVRVKNPHLLRIGDYSWIGEDCWIDNLAEVRIGSHVCISQKAYFCTGNHDWSEPSFCLRASPISVDDGAWIGAGSMIAPGVRIRSHAVAAAGSVVTRDIPAWEIHSGNPAHYVRSREMRSSVAAAGSSLVVLLLSCFLSRTLPFVPIRQIVEGTMSHSEEARTAGEKAPGLQPGSVVEKRSGGRWRTL